jgi:hypothetical protein
MEKMTKMQYFTEVLKYVEGNEELTNFIKHEMELVKAKNARRSNAPTKAQKENAVLGASVVEKMEVGKRYTVSELQKEVAEIAELSNQRASAILKALVKAGSVARVEEKGKAYFTLA